MVGPSKRPTSPRKSAKVVLVEHIRKSAERSILFFTNSVQHAEEMSARLNLAGISAAAVSGSTRAVARRHFLDRFQRSEIRVLCNHSVLTTGFDAPRTEMVLISRQVFSPVRYMQMVGRGLRGEKNGGTARCRIVTMVDNLGRY
jgi:superfamily II DNA or RNA helicase